MNTSNSRVITLRVILVFLLLGKNELSEGSWKESEGWRGDVYLVVRDSSRVCSRKLQTDLHLGKSALWAGWVVNTAGGTLEKDEIVTGVT